MATAIEHIDLLDFKATQLYRSQTIQVCLSNTSLNATSTPEAIFSSEILPSNGYTRASHSYAATDGGLDSNNNLYMPQVQVTFTATGGPLSWSSAFILLNGKSASGMSFQSSDVNTSSGQITLTNHGLINGDRLMFAADPAGGSLPGGIQSTVRYYVKQVDANTLTIYTDLALTQQVSFTNAGTGTMQAIYASGRIVGVIQESVPVNLNAGQSYTYLISLGETKS